MSSAFEAIHHLLLQHQSFVLTTHVNPDGDGLGCEIALAEWLIARGKTVTILNVSPTPVVYRFLDPKNRVKEFRGEEHAVLIKTADVIVVLDTNQPERLRAMQEHVLASPAVTICIDHHLHPHPFAQHYLIDEGATSTGEIMHRLLFPDSSTTIAQPVAEALYCAIMTDTGSFRYPRVDGETFRIAARLVDAGADPVHIFHQVYEQWSPGRLQLLGACLEGLETFYDGRLACITITRRMLDETGTTEEDTDNFTTFPMSIAGVASAVLFLELKNGIKISFRSKGDIPINVLAGEFGGGGHKNAAGARLEGRTIDDVKKEVLRSAGKYVDNAVIPFEPFHKA